MPYNRAYLHHSTCVTLRLCFASRQFIIVNGLSLAFILKISMDSLNKPCFAKLKNKTQMSICVGGKIIFALNRFCGRPSYSQRILLFSFTRCSAQSRNSISYNAIKRKSHSHPFQIAIIHSALKRPKLFFNDLYHNFTTASPLWYLTNR